MDGWIWIALYAGLFFVMMRYGCGAHMMGHKGGHEGHENHGDDEGHREQQAALPNVPSRRGGVFVDPVCGMAVPRDEGYGKMYQGIPYRFCSRDCLDKFDADAERYVNRVAEHVS